MKKRSGRLPAARLAWALFLAGAGWHARAAGIEREELKTGVTFDVGQIRRGVLENGRVEAQMIQRTGVHMVQSAVLGQRLRVTVGIGGLFWYSMPEQAMAHTRLTKFGPGVGQAQGSLKLGDLEDPWGRLRFGLIPFKYNPDARNLGEYLLRSSAYPNVLVTGGWSIINSADALMQGVDFEARTGSLTHNLLVSLERGMGPQYDITPAYLGAWKPHPAFELGAGAAFASLVPIRGALTTPDGPGKPGDASVQPLNRFRGGAVVVGDSVLFRDGRLDTLGAPVGAYENYTFRAVKLMARAAFDLKALIRSDALGPHDLRLYAEAAVLGVKDYAYYYEDVMRRIPVMVGFNLPVFRLLDILAVEAEFRNPEFANSSRASYEESALPLPYIKAANSTLTYGQVLAAHDKDAWKRHGLKWSVYGRRTLTPGLALHAQAASDHMRGIHFNGYPLSEPVTRTASDWYFLFRIELGL